MFPPPLNPMQRESVRAPLATGVRAIDGLLTCGRGQRLGLFGGSGVGKSTLLGMMTRGTAADVIVLALVGERGREVRGFLDHDLGPAGRERSVVVVSTSDNPPLLRMRAAYTATSMAEYFRDQGKHVLLLMDSVTRFAMAQREVGLAAGEPPTTKGYPPSVFAALPSLLERAGGVRGGGSITARLHRARRRRRSQRADRRRRARDSRRPHRAVARSGAPPSLSADRRAAEREPHDARRRRRVASASGRARCASGSAAIRDSDDLVNVGAYVEGTQLHGSTSAGSPGRSIDRFLCQDADTLCRFSDTVDGALGVVTIGYHIPCDLFDSEHRQRCSYDVVSTTRHL